MNCAMFCILALHVICSVAHAEGLHFSPFITEDVLTLNSEVYSLGILKVVFMREVYLFIYRRWLFKKQGSIVPWKIFVADDRQIFKGKLFFLQVKLMLNMEHLLPHFRFKPDGEHPTLQAYPNLQLKWYKRLWRWIYSIVWDDDLSASIHSFLNPEHVSLLVYTALKCSSDCL